MPPPTGAHAVSMKMTKNANHRSQFQAQLQTQAQLQHKKVVGASYNKRLKLMDDDNNNHHHDIGRRKSVDDAYDGENDRDRGMDVERSGSNSTLTRGKDASKSTIGAYARMVRRDKGAGGDDDRKPAFQSQNNKAVAQKIGDQQSSSRGLRHFSEKVAKKVQEKGHTTYQEVADELVYEYVVQNQPETLDNGAINFKKVEHKNIRRRVYDALNVLMAMDIISKKNKDIFWRGLPDSQDREDLKQLKREKNNRNLELDRKRSMLLRLLKQQVVSFMMRSSSSDLKGRVSFIGSIVALSEFSQKKSSEARKSWE